MSKFIKIGEVVINIDSTSTASADGNGVLIVMNNGNAIRLDMDGCVSVESSILGDSPKVHKKNVLTSPAKLWELLLYTTEPYEAKPDKLPRMQE